MRHPLVREVAVFDLGFKRLDNRAILPSYGRPGDACLDLFAIEDQEVFVGSQVQIRTGLACAVPAGYEMVIRGRGGKTNQRLWCFHGTVDSNYRDEILVLMENRHPYKVHRIEAGKAFAQIAVKPIPTWQPCWLEDLGETNRGGGRFGSSDLLREQLKETELKFCICAIPHKDVHDPFCLHCGKTLIK